VAKIIIDGEALTMEEDLDWERMDEALSSGDAALKTINRYLEPNGISSVGRFGAWRYEAGNMDHSFLMGHAVPISASRR